MKTLLGTNSPDLHVSHDRLTLIFETNGTVSLVGFRPAEDNETAELEKGFPTDGRWRMDYVDTIHGDNAFDFAQSVADAMWGTVYSDSGDIVTNSLLSWNELRVDDEHFTWAVRNKHDYDMNCEQVGE